MSDTLRVSNLHFGLNTSNYNQPQLGFTSVGIGSIANYGFLQFFGTSNTLCWTANGTVGIGMTAPLATLDVTGSFRVLSNANTALTSGSGVDIIYSGGGQLSSGTRGVAGALTAATMNYAAAAHTFTTGTAGGTNALTIGMDQTCITHGDQWTVGNVGGANSSGNWATLGQNMYFCGGFGSQTTTTVNYKSCCISWNGQYVLFTVTNAGYGPYFSNNGGRSLSIISPAASNVGSYWGSAMSASGQYILVANTTTVWLSSNYLPMNLTATFSYSGYTSVLSVTSTNNALAMSSSGQYCVFAYTASATTGGIYLSSNYGVTWALVSGTNYPWTSVSMSSSGQYITACCNGTPNNIYISSNWGASFALPVTSLSAISNWVSVKVSASAQWQVACANSAIYYSSNYGVTWTAVGANITLPSGTWGAVAISPNGRYMTATNNAATSYIFTNSNYGVGAWTQGSGTFEVGYFLAMSATGTLAIVSNGGAVLMSALTSTATPSLAPSLLLSAHPSVSANAMLTVNSVAGNGVINLGTNAAVPAAGFFGGAGDKVILYPGTATVYPYSIGISSATIWNSVPSGAQFQWFNNGTAQMTLNSSGQLGIGTAPGYTLDVNGTSKLGGIGTPFKSVVAFIASLGAGGTGVNQFTITFPSAYTNTTKLIINVTMLGELNSSNGDTVSNTIRTIATTSFVLNVVRTDVAAAWGQTLRANVVVYELP